MSIAVVFTMYREEEAQSLARIQRIVQAALDGALLLLHYPLQGKKMLGRRDGRCLTSREYKLIGPMGGRFDNINQDVIVSSTRAEVLCSVSFQEAKQPGWYLGRRT